jgi:hypothetical protein
MQITISPETLARLGADSEEDAKSGVIWALRRNYDVLPSGWFHVTLRMRRESWGEWVEVEAEVIVEEPYVLAPVTKNLN